MSKMIKCRYCSKEITANARVCPECGAKINKPIYKKPWFIVMVLLVIFMAIGAINNKGDTSKEKSEVAEKDQQAAINKEAGENVKAAENSSEVREEEKPAVEIPEEKPQEAVAEEPTAQASNEQKTEENVSTEYKNALRMAKLYSDTIHMSKAGLYNQLTSEYGEKFTAEEAQYAIDNLQ